MPNPTVTANAEAMPAFDRSAIMAAAWAGYRAWHAMKERTFGPRRFDRQRFGMGLSAEWRYAREARMSPRQRQAQRIRDEIEALKYKSLRYDIGAMRQRLQAELAALEAGPAAAPTETLPVYLMTTENAVTDYLCDDLPDALSKTSGDCAVGEMFGITEPHGKVHFFRKLDAGMHLPMTVSYAAAALTKQPTNPPA